jgi:hypothetical protein
MQEVRAAFSQQSTKIDFDGKEQLNIQLGRGSKGHFVSF